MPVWIGATLASTAWSRAASVRWISGTSKRDEVGAGRDGEVGLAVASEGGLHGALDALAFECVEVDGRGRHQQRRDHDAQEDADHETPVCAQAPEDEMTGCQVVRVCGQESVPGSLSPHN